MSSFWINLPAYGAGNYKGKVATTGDLPLVGNAPGDARIVVAGPDLYIWNGTAWEQKTVGTGNGSFKTMQTPLGTSPVATSQTDVLTWDSSGGTLDITGNSTTDTINLDITDNSITNAKINAAAGIVYTKLDLTNSIVNADVNASAAIVYSKLSLTNSIVNADINSAAAIARSKIAAGTANHVVINDGSGNLSSEARLAVSRGGRGTITTLTDAAIIATDASLSNIFTVTLGGNRTLGAPTNPSDGQTVIWRVRQDATGGRTLAFDAIFRFSNDIVTPVMSTTANATDYIGAIYSAADSKWDVVAVDKGHI